MLYPVLGEKGQFDKQFSDLDWNTDGVRPMVVVLEFLSAAKTGSISTDLVIDGWRTCHTLLARDVYVFVDNDGLTLAFRALEQYQDTSTIVNIIFEILHLVANTHPQHLLTRDYLNQLIKLLQDPVQAISYISCQVLARLLFKCSKHWCLDEPTQDDIAYLVQQAIMTWNMDADMQMSAQNADVQREYLLSYRTVLQQLAAWELR
jgi:hypothetical protein